MPARLSYWTRRIWVSISGVALGEQAVDSDGESGGGLQEGEAGRGVLAVEVALV